VGRSWEAAWRCDAESIREDVPRADAFGKGSFLRLASGVRRSVAIDDEVFQTLR